MQTAKDNKVKRPALSQQAEELAFYMPFQSKCHPLAAFFLTILRLGGFAALRYQRWIKACTRQLEDGSKVIETAKGKVECAVFGTAGPVILFAHGQPGGYDQGRLLSETAVQHGFRMITVSRPGYLRRPLDAGQSPTGQPTRQELVWAEGFGFADLENRLAASRQLSPATQFSWKLKCYCPSEGSKEVSRKMAANRLAEHL